MTADAETVIADYLATKSFDEVWAARHARAILHALSEAGIEFVQWKPWPGPEDGTEVLVWRKDQGTFIAQFIAPAHIFEKSDDYRPAWHSICGDYLGRSLRPTHWAEPPIVKGP